MIKVIYLDELPDVLDMDFNVLYISEKHGCTKHLCGCGCGELTVLPINNIIKGHDYGWKLIRNGDGTVSMTPSVGNFSGEVPYHAHYYITRSEFVFC